MLNFSRHIIIRFYYENMCTRKQNIINKIGFNHHNKEKGAGNGWPNKNIFLPNERDCNTAQVKKGRNERYYDMYINNQHQQKESGLKNGTIRLYPTSLL